MSCALGLCQLGFCRQQVVRSRTAKTMFLANSSFFAVVGQLVRATLASAAATLLG